jgi:two-component system phosphate regulon sensor histidine kinase PhoR
LNGIGKPIGNFDRMRSTLKEQLQRILLPWICLAAVAAVVPPFLIRGLEPMEAAAIALAFVVIASIGVRILIVRIGGRIARELEQITITARENARGDLARNVDIESLSVVELRDLATAINAMSARARGDIAEMKRLARVRSEFLGNVSHELRTPIFAVQGYIETLIDGAIDDPVVCHDFLDKAHHNVLRLHTLLTDLIEISRIESGEMKMSFRYFDPVAYVRSIVEELRPTAEISGIDLTFTATGLADENPTALGDRDRLKQVITNLVENAIKYNRPDGEVRVEVELAPRKVTISVADSGIGIPPSDLDRIFERFYRVNRDRSRSVGGSGLGLAIVKHIIEAHGSRIVVESEPGIGSRFSFSLRR